MFNFNKFFEDIGKSNEVTTHNPEKGERDSLRLNESEMVSEDPVEDLLAEFEAKSEAKTKLRKGHDEWDADEVADEHSSNMEDEILDKIDREATGENSKELDELKAKYGETKDDSAVNEEPVEAWKTKYVNVNKEQKKEWLKVIIRKIYDKDFVNFKKIDRIEKDKIFKLLNQKINRYIIAAKEQQMVAEGKRGLAKKLKEDAEWEVKLAEKNAKKVKKPGRA